MTSKLISASALALVGLCPLTAQASDSTLASQVERLDNTVRMLEQTGILVLLGGALLMSIVWGLFIWRECAFLARPQKGKAKLLSLVASLSLLCSSCALELQATATPYPAAASAERSDCPSPHHSGNTPLSMHYPSSGDYFNGHSPFCCKYCGQRVFNRY